VPESLIVETLIEEALRLADEIGAGDGEGRAATSGGPVVSVS
jgi:(E)-4-hydroxy-3-methylbut-2-enyl-diphosphate synthase